MISIVAIISAIILGIYNRCFWLLGLSLAYLLLAVSVGLTLWPLADYIRYYANVLPYLTLIFLVVYLVGAIYVAFRHRNDGRVPKIPVVCVVIAAVLRIASFLYTRYLHSFFLEPAFDHDKFESAANIGRYLTGFMLVACCCILVYYVFYSRKTRGRFA